MKYIYIKEDRLLEDYPLIIGESYEGTEGIGDAVIIIYYLNDEGWLRSAPCKGSCLAADPEGD